MKITQEMIPELRKAYDKAVLEKKDTFIFKEHEFFTGYVKYLLEYADSKK